VVHRQNLLSSRGTLFSDNQKVRWFNGSVLLAIDCYSPTAMLIAKLLTKYNGIFVVFSVSGIATTTLAAIGVFSASGKTPLLS
jgi:hypothetical protein